MKSSGVTPIQPASCSAATPLPIRITASTATQADVHEKNWPIGMRALLRSKAQAMTASSTMATRKPPSRAPPLPSAASAE